MPDDFWNLTPAELNIIIEVYIQKQKAEYKEKITVAYYNAYFQRVKKMPQLEKILEDIDKAGQKEMTDEQMFKAVQKLHGALKKGGKR